MISWDPRNDRISRKKRFGLPLSVLQKENQDDKEEGKKERTT